LSGASSVGIVEVAPERSYFKSVVVDDDKEDSKSNANGNGFGEEGLDGFWGGVGSDVNVIGGELKEIIAHPSARIVGDVAGLVEGVDDEASLGAGIH
jgi:hypothetical protein